MKVFKNKPSHIKIATPIRYLVVAMASALPIMVSQADVKNTQIGDLEIFQPATAGKAIVTMMLDTSGSMGSSSIQVDGLSCSSPKVFTENFNFTDTNGNIIKTFTKADGTTATVGTNGVLAANYVGCDVNNMTRLSRVKKAMFGLLTNGQAISANNEIGMGNFSAGGDGYRGMMAVPAKPLTPEQRLNLLNYVNALVANGGTPTAHAYAEAGAYLMGTNTSAGLVNATRYTEQGVSIPYSSSSYQLFQCLATNFQPTTFNGQTWYSCLYASNQGIGGEGYYGAYPLGYNNYYIDNKTSASALNLGLIGNPTTTVTPTKLVSQTGNGKTYTSGTVYGTAKTQYWPTDTDIYTKTIMSGFGLSNNTTKTADTKNYQSPITSDTNAASCDGYGVYFLTDGEPNQNSRFDTQPMMGVSLNDNSFTCDGGLPIAGSVEGTSTTSTGVVYSESGWDCIGAYSKRLNSTNNPIGKPLKTAAVGFGATFASMANSTRTIQVKDSNGNLVNKAIPDCSKGSEVDTQNLCQLTELKSDPASSIKSGGWGEGGFTATSNANDVASSLQNFLGSLNNSFPSTPSGTIVVPDDPYRADSQLAIAYYPTLLANVSQSPAIWSGNVKKYNLNEGTLFGSNAQPLFSDISGSLNATTPDLWSSADVPNANNTVTAGGYSSQLPLPTSTTLTPTRTLWLEDFTSATDTTPKLRKFSVNSSGKVTLDGAVLSTSNTFFDTATYGKTTDLLNLSSNTAIAQRGLLNFLGYNGFDTTKTLATVVIGNPAAATRIVGASVHSTPVAVSYSATLDSNGKVGNTRDDYALFGSSDGALHLVDADDASNTNGGKELFAFIPKTMLQNQPNALVSGGTSTKGIDNPYAGVDAPWVVTADYKYDFSNSQVNVDTGTGKGVFAYGGLRMGGTNLYGMNITNHDTPSLMFDISPSSTGFTRMGQIWSQPTKTKMKLTASDTTGTDVLIFGGGYDTCYENQNFQIGIAATTANAISTDCASKTQAQGNALYIVNAKTGALIWSASSDSSATTVVPSMKNSIVGGVTVLDRNNDGITDNLYFADLGGQVYRADFNKGVASASSARVTRVLKNTYEGTSTPQYAMRFYERPVVSFYRNPNTNTLFALVNVISGDRSSPLSTLRTNTAYADRLYGIIDSDITKPDTVFYASNFTDSTNTAGQKIVDLTDSNFSALPTAIGTGNSFTAAQKTAAIATMQSGTSRGWYYPLTRFDGYANVPNGKGMGKSAVVGSYLYTTVYNPNMNYGTTDSCTAKVAGGSERELYCLPYGICTDTTSPTGTGGYARAGQGIQELTLGPRSATLGNQRLLIGTQTLAQRVANRKDFNDDATKGLASDVDPVTGKTGTGLSVTSAGTGMVKAGGDGSAAEIIFNERYALTPNTWYEVTK